MHSNYTLKQAVITALTILAMGAQNNALALGLGNIDVKSHLGQPLRASIKIHGANDLKSEDCFRVINDSSVENQLTRANLKLSKTVDDVAILTVTTNKIINDPIVNLSIMAECDANMRRDFVLLLDPPLVAEDANSAPEMANNVEEQIVVTEPAKLAQTVKIAKPSKKAASAKKHKNSNNTNKNIVLTTGYRTENSTEATTNSANNPAEKERQPRLVISGGDSTNANLNSAVLRMDNELHFTPETAPLAATADIDLQDDVTVLNNRLVHLEKQISELSLANQKLKTENQIKAQKLEEANSLKNKLGWLGYILGGGLLLSSLTVGEKWLRRRQIQKLESARLAWDTNTELASNLDAFNTNDDFFEAETQQKMNGDVEKIIDLPEEPAPVKEPVVPFSVEEFNTEHNILDHADVFLSHGRTSLAIQLLQNHLLDLPKQSVTIWMFLLDLLAKENLQAVYEQTALECKEHFNIHIAEFSKSDGDTNQSLEAFPRISSGLQQLWGTPAALTYLDDLIYNSRLEIRVGFHKNVIEELLLLKSVAQEELKTAEVIHMDERKLELKELKEAQLAAKKEEKLKLMDEQALKSAEEKAAEAKISPKERFEFNMVEFK